MDHDGANRKIVIFDLETNGLNYSSEICQISAVIKTQMFNVYMVPTKIDPEATNVNRLHVCGGKMYREEKLLYAAAPRVGLLAFIEFLRKIGGDIILVAHNGFGFDAPVIMYNMEKFGLLEDFTSVAKGFADTLQIFREHLPQRVKSNKSFSLTALAAEFLDPGANETAHDARTDIRNLKQLIDVFGIRDEIIRNSARTTREFRKSNLTRRRETLPPRGEEVLQSILQRHGL